MKILIVSEDIPYPNMGGLAKHALTLARALIKAGHEVDFLGGSQNPIEVAGDEGRFGGRFFGELSGHLAGWKELRIGMFLPPRRTWLARRFARIIMRHAHAYDVVHYHGHVPNVAKFIPADINFIQTRHDHGSDCILNTRFRKNSICETTDPAQCIRCFHAHPNVLQRAISEMAVVKFRREVAESFRRHKTVFVSDMLQRNFARTMGNAKWGVTIHNFIDLAALKRAREAVAGTPASDETRVFVAGKLIPSKGIEPFLRELLPCMPANMRVDIAGDGGDAARLQGELQSGQVRFLGWCSPETTLKMAAAAHAIVVPSVWEDPCPSTILEGLLLGKPTYALNRGGTPEMARYAVAPGQLHLHADMRSLVRDLVSGETRTAYAPTLDGPGGADHAVEKLLHLYRMPPGRIFA